MTPQEELEKLRKRVASLESEVVELRAELRPKPETKFNKLRLSPRETQIVQLLLRAYPETLPHERLDALAPSDVHASSLRRSMITHIRRKTGLEIKSYWGFGYSLTKQDKEKLDQLLAMENGNGQSSDDL